MFGSTLRESLQGVFQDERDPLDVDQKESLCASLYFELINEIEEKQHEDCVELKTEDLVLVAGTYINGDHFLRNMVVGTFKEEVGGLTIEGGILFVARSVISEWQSRALVAFSVTEDQERTWMIFERGEGDEEVSQLRGKRRMQRHFRRSHNKFGGVMLSEVTAHEDLQDHFTQIDRDLSQVRSMVLRKP